MNEKNLNLLQELWKRLKTEKPAFFEKLQVWLFGIAGFLVLIIACIDWLGIIPVQFQEYADKISLGLWFVITFLGGSAFAAQTATTKGELQDDKTKENVIKSTSATEIHEIKYK